VFSRISGHGPLATRLPTRGRNWKQRDLAQPLLLFLSLPAVTTTVTYKRRKNTSKDSVFPSLLDLLSSGFSLSLDSLIFLLQVTDPAIG